MDRHDAAARLAVRVRQHRASAGSFTPPSSGCCPPSSDGCADDDLRADIPGALGLSSFVRPPARRRRAFRSPRERLAFYRARNAIYYLFEALRSLNPSLTVLVPDYNSGNEILALHAAGATLHYCRIGPRHAARRRSTSTNCAARHDPDVLYVIHYLGWPQPIDTLGRSVPRARHAARRRLRACRC